MPQKPKNELKPKKELKPRKSILVFIYTKLDKIQNPHALLREAMKASFENPSKEEVIKKFLISFLRKKKIPEEKINHFINLPLAEAHSLSLALENLTRERKKFPNISEFKKYLLSLNFSPKTIEEYFNIYSPTLSSSFIEPPLSPLRENLPREKIPQPKKPISTPVSIQPDKRNEKSFRFTPISCQDFFRLCEIKAQTPKKLALKEILMTVEREFKKTDEKSRKREIFTKHDKYSPFFLEAASKLLLWWRTRGKNLDDLYSLLEKEKLSDLSQILKSGTIGVYIPRYTTSSPGYRKK